MRDTRTLTLCLRAPSAPARRRPAGARGARPTAARPGAAAPAGPPPAAAARRQTWPPAACAAAPVRPSMHVSLPASAWHCKRKEVHATDVPYLAKRRWTKRRCFDTVKGTIKQLWRTWPSRRRQRKALTSDVTTSSAHGFQHQMQTRASASRRSAAASCRSGPARPGAPCWTAPALSGPRASAPGRPWPPPARAPRRARARAREERVQQAPERGHKVLVAARRGRGRGLQSGG